MTQSHRIEFSVGLLILVGILAFFFLALQVSNLTSVGAGEDGYRLIARFHNVGSLKPRAAVTLAGVRIGRVQSISVDPRSFDAVVEMRINHRFSELPDDSFANIYTAGLLGEQYVALEPGGNDQFLKDGDVMLNTQSALVLEQIVGQFLFSKAQEAAKP